MRRREFITLLGGTAAAWPFSARAQQPERISRVGVLLPNVQNDPKAKAELSAFMHGLAELGWTDGRNLRMDIRWAAGSVDRARTYANELVRLQPDVILAESTPQTAALQRETTTIPIVFVASLARPWANITGFSNFEQSMAGKWVEILCEISPGLSRVVVIFNPESMPQTGYYVSSIEDAARQLAVEPVIIRLYDDSDMERALATIRNEAAGLVVPPVIYTPAMRMQIISAVARHGIPAIYWSRNYAAEGGLAAYGVDDLDLWQRAASYVDRILKGEKPTDLPVQAPTKFELVINLKTAKALGLAVPISLLASADEVIE